VNLVSACISTYDRNDLLLERSLASVRRQTYSVAEIIIVNDGMGGEKLDELEQRIEALGDGRIRLFTIPRQTYPEDPQQRWCVLGMNARNFALDVAEGDWVAPLDDDDEWTDDHVAVLMATLQQTTADFAYGISQYHWPDGHFQQAGRWPPGMGAFCDGAQLYRNGLGYRYDPGCIGRGLPEDGDLWTRMWEGGVNFTFEPRLVHHYYPSPR